MQFRQEKSVTSPAASIAATHSSENGAAFGGGFNVGTSCLLLVADSCLPFKKLTCITQLVKYQNRILEVETKGLPNCDYQTLSRTKKLTNELFCCCLLHNKYHLLTGAPCRY